MKYLFISDIHGSLSALDNALSAFKTEEADYIVILGDILYHGPRNPLPHNYNPKEVAEKLNEISDKVIAIRGNCDSEVDQMVLDFPMMSDYSFLIYENRRFFLTHGHIFSLENRPKLSKGDVLAHGHTHILAAEEVDSIYRINPGSISIPKGGNPCSYGILHDNCFKIKTFNGDVLKTLSFK